MSDQPITCSWCGRPILPKTPRRMRVFQYENISVSGKWLATFHPGCGDEMLDFCHTREAALLVANASAPVEKEPT